MTVFAPTPEGWTEIVHELNGRPAARLLKRGTEVHFEIAPEFKHKVIRRHVTREFLKPAFEESGFLTTRTTIGDELAASFIKRLGFVKSWSDDSFDYYMMTALPFGKGN